MLLLQPQINCFFPLRNLTQENDTWSNFHMPKCMIITPIRWMQPCFVFFARCKRCEMFHVSIFLQEPYHSNRMTFILRTKSSLFLCVDKFAYGKLIFSSYFPVLIPLLTLDRIQLFHKQGLNACSMLWESKLNNVILKNLKFNFHVKPSCLPFSIKIMYSRMNKDKNPKWPQVKHCCNWHNNNKNVFQIVVELILVLLTGFPIVQSHVRKINILNGWSDIDPVPLIVHYYM